MDDAVLLLFDIDGTLLIRATDDHRDAVHAALRRVWHVDRPQDARIDPAGRTDPEIARAILLQNDVSAERDRRRGCSTSSAPRPRSTRSSAASDLSATSSRPGVVDLLEELRGAARRPCSRSSPATSSRSRG